MARSVFYGVGAFVGSITGPTTCAFWPDDPVKLKWDPKLLVQVDLANNPESCRQGKIAPGQVEVDDFAGYGTGGLTRIGPMYPGGAVLGTVYLEDSRCGALGANDPRKAPNAYEWATVVYYDGPLAGRRFHGFNGTVHKATGNLALVSLAPRSAGAGSAPSGTYWLDFAAHVHPADPALPSITPTPGAVGAVYIDVRAGGGGGIGFDPPKNPRYLGGVAAPGGRRVR